MKFDVEGQHFVYMERINKLYSAVIKSKAFNSGMASELEKLCLADITLAPAFWKSIKSTCKNPPVYPSFRQLVSLYEKQGEYKKAMDICKKAIKQGFNDDGTAMKMSGRLDKLKNKL